MLISKEKAERIAELSYKVYEYDNRRDFITYKKALELDNGTGDKLIIQLERQLKDLHLVTEAKKYGGKICYADDEIVEIDNFQYVDFIEYGVYKNGLNKKITSIKCKLLNGEDFEIKEFSRVYGPNIYKGMFGFAENDKPIFKDLQQVEVYLKLLIVEDRLINPYKIINNNDGYSQIVIGMKEKSINFMAYEKEIDLLNRLLNICNGKYISNGHTDIAIKPTVLYLEGIGKYDLANEFRKYDRDSLKLNLALDMAYKGYFGIAFIGRRFSVKLL